MGAKKKMLLPRPSRGKVMWNRLKSHQVRVEVTKAFQEATMKERTSSRAQRRPFHADRFSARPKRGGGLSFHAQFQAKSQG